VLLVLLVPLLLLVLQRVLAMVLQTGWALQRTKVRGLGQDMASQPALPTTETERERGRKVLPALLALLVRQGPLQPTVNLHNQGRRRR